MTHKTNYEKVTTILQHVAKDETLSFRKKKKLYVRKRELKENFEYFNFSDSKQRMIFFLCIKR